MAASFLAVLLWMFCAAFGAVFIGMRIRHRSRKRRGLKRIGFYPSGAALGNALHQLQVLALPQIEYVMHQKLDEPAEETDSGEPDEAAARQHILRQVARLRRGERIDRLTAIRASQTRR